MSDTSMSDPTQSPKQELILRLRGYLQGLSGDSHQTLMRTIDRARARGEASPVHSIIMDALRDLKGGEGFAERIPSVERSFFSQLDAVILSTPLPDKQVGRIDRASLRPIWIWITRDLAPGRLDGELAALRAATVDEDSTAIAECAAEFRRAVCLAVREEMDMLDKQYGTLQRMEAQLGSSRVMSDLHDMIAVFEQRDIIDSFLSKMPDKLPVGQEGLAVLEKGLRIYTQEKEANPIYAFAAVVDRMGSASDLVRFAVKHAKSSDPAIIRQTRAAGAVQIALSEAALEVEYLRQNLTSERDLDKVVTHMRRLHELASSIALTLDDEPTDPWLKHLAGIRARASDLLSKELEPLLHMIKRVVGVVESRGKEIVPDAASVNEAAFGTTLFMIAREVRGSLAINSVIERTEKGIETILEGQGKQAIDRLGSASDENWLAATARSAAAVRLYKVYYGGVMGATMARRHAATVESRSLSQSA
jgi:hypothetical protein